MICYKKSGNFKIEELKNKLKKHPKMDGLNLSSSITTKKKYKYTESVHELISSEVYNLKNFKPKIAVIDFGVKQNILRHLVNLNAEVNVFSENASIKDINNFKPDGIF